MNNSSKYLVRSIVLLVLVSWFSSCYDEGSDVLQDQVKVAMRDVGHRLLLSNQDSTSLVSPVVALDDSFKYQISFEENLSIHPDTIVALVRTSFQKADLPPHYLVEVIGCEDGEVAYSYEMKEDVEKGIVPCRGRELKIGCYDVTIRFTKVPETASSNDLYYYLLALGVLIVLVVFFFIRKSKTKSEPEEAEYASLGRFKFYPEQNKLIKEAIEIGLSRKECELLAILVAQPNQTIKRDLLTKKVWEDNGVIVGRSLDTYISKLRKKLQGDDSIKITNVHGVGYKLEIR